MFVRCACLAIAVLLTAARVLTGQPAIEADRRYAAVVELLQGMITHEMRDKDIPAISIALVDSQRVIWARGFGWADSARGVRATAETVYRVGSVSKLFSDLAVMPLVERGALSLDADIKRYVPGFAPRSPYGTALTLRQLMSHRSGRVREPPAGPGDRQAGCHARGYDEMSDRSYPMYPGGTSRQRGLRELLREAMEREGFRVYEAEWWHFDCKDWRLYRIGNQTFEGIGDTG